MKFWKYEDKDAYQRRKAGDILKRNPLPEPVPERAPRPPVAPLGPQPIPRQPRPSLLRPSTWPTVTGIPTGAPIVKTPWMQTLMGAVGGPEAAQRAEPAVAWQRWLSSLTRERVAQPLAGELTMGGPLRALFDPGERRALAANWADVLAGRRTYGEVAAERAATAREAWRQAPVPGVARAATETLLDPLGMGGAMIAAPLMGAGGLAGVLGKLYMAVDVADMGAYLASATPEELGAVVVLMGAAKLAPKVVGLIEQALPKAGRAARKLRPAVRRFMAEEVGAAEMPGRAPERLLTETALHQVGFMPGMPRDVSEVLKSGVLRSDTGLVWLRPGESEATLREQMPTEYKQMVKVSLPSDLRLLEVSDRAALLAKLGVSGHPDDPEVARAIARRLRESGYEGFVRRDFPEMAILADVPHRVLGMAALEAPLELRPEVAEPTARPVQPDFLTPEERRPVFGREGLPRRVPEAAPEAMRRMEVPPEEAARLEREAAEAAGQRRLEVPVPEGYRLHVAFNAIRHQYNRHALGQDARAKLSVMTEEEFVSFIHRLALETPELTTDVLEQTALRLLADRPTPTIWGRDIPWNRFETEHFPLTAYRGPTPKYEVPAYRPPAKPAAPAPEGPPMRAPVTRPVAPSAEPAVPPPAVPAVPPVTAQPVPGAGGILGGPVAPGAGAAVGQGVLPGIGVPAGPPAAPPQPPTAPPGGAPPAPPTQPQFGTVGPTPPGRWLPNLKNTDEILREHYRPDWARRFTDWAERSSQAMARLIHFVGIPERSHAAKIRILWSEVVGDLYAAAEGAMARVRRLGSERALFDVVEGQAHIAGKPVAMGDLLEHIDDYPVSGVQRQYAETMHKIYDDAAAMAEAEGIEVNKLSFADGGHYVGRRTMGRRLADGTVVEAATITGGPTKRWVGGRAPFEKAREFATEQEALDAGYEYLDFADAQAANLRSLARRVANERVEQYVLANIPARVGKKARLGEVTLPGPSFRGRWFLPGDVKGVREYLEGTDYSIPRKAADVIRSLSRLPRLMLTAFDLGPAFIQLQAMGFSYPKQWAKAVWHGFEALLSERRYYEIMTQHADTITRWTPDGLIISRVGGTEWTEFLRQPGPILKRVPGLMRAARAPARMFDATLNFARILGIEATESLAKTDMDRVELARFWNLFTGVVDPSRQGLSETQQAVEAAALFAPRYGRAVFGIMTDIAHGGLRGKMARESLAKVAVSGLATYIGLCAALNQKPELDPRKRGTWLTIGLAGQRVGIGGGFYGATRVLGQIVTDPENAADHAARFLKGKLSPAVRSGMVALTRQDFLGRALDTPWKLTKELIVGNFTPIWLQGTIEAGKDWRALTAVTAAEIVGLRTFPESPATRRTNLREQFAQQQFGRAWADLHQGEKYELETTVPALAAVTEEARGLARERRSPWAMYRQDLEQMREPVRMEIANLTRQFDSGLMDGNQYREEIQTRQMMIARMSDFLRNVERYQGLEYAEQEPKNAVDRFIDSYYQVAEVLTDPRTGYADAAQIVRQRDWLMQETPAGVVSQGMPYINKTLDPKYIEARDLMREYQRIPQYIGLSDEQAQAANEAMRKYTAMRRANPMISPDVTRSLLAQQDPRALVLMQMAYSRRNPARRMFWAMHPLLSVFYSELTEEEVEMVAPQMQQTRLPSWAGMA